MNWCRINNQLEVGGSNAMWDLRFRRPRRRNLGTFALAFGNILDLCKMFGLFIIGIDVDVYVVQGIG